MFPTRCSSCGSPLEKKMLVFYYWQQLFKQIVLVRFHHEYWLLGSLEQLCVSTGLQEKLTTEYILNTRTLVCAWAQISLEGSAKDKRKSDVSQTSAAYCQNKLRRTKKMLEMRKGWPNRWQHIFFFFLQLALCVENSSKTYAHSTTWLIGDLCKFCEYLFCQRFVFT